MDQNQPHIIVIGNPVDGFEFYGPFANVHAAITFGNTDGDLPDEWWTAPLHAVDCQPK